METMSFCKRVNYLHRRIWCFMLSAICWAVILLLLQEDLAIPAVQLDASYTDQI